jgi:hypothetical protein
MQRLVREELHHLHRKSSCVGHHTMLDRRRCYQKIARHGRAAENTDAITSIHRKMLLRATELLRLGWRGAWPEQVKRAL